MVDYTFILLLALPITPIILLKGCIKWELNRKIFIGQFVYIDHGSEFLVLDFTYFLQERASGFYIRILNLSPNQIYGGSLRMKKSILLIIMAILLGTLFTGCSSNKKATEKKGTEKKAITYKGEAINVVSREEGSGTRGAFIELFGVEVKNADGTKKDMTTKDAQVVNNTEIVLSNVASDDYGIGYVSLGSLNDKVKALQINGVDATEANVKNGSYKISRPFNIVTKGEKTGVAKDFIDFILSADGQKVVSKSYIAVNEQAPAYAGSKPSGKVVVAGSSSVTPIMEKLKEAYVKINPNANVEILMSDSTTGINAAINGTCDIGMASRDLKDTEKDKVGTTQIAIDGIGVIVNKNNPLKTLTNDEVRKIYVGETKEWTQDK